MPPGRLPLDRNSRDVRRCIRADEMAMPRNRQAQLPIAFAQEEIAMKIVLLILGAFIVLVGAGCTAAGGALAVLAGRDGWVDSGTQRADTTGYAITSDTADLDDDDVPTWFGGTRIRFRAEDRGGDDVFIGVGRAGDVTRYLSGVEHDVVDDFNAADDDVETTNVPGDSEPEPPAEQSFWVEQVNGSGQQTLDWNPDSGSYRVIVMNADGSSGVDIDGSAAVKIPHLIWIALGVLVAGLVGVAAGVGVILAGVRYRSASPPAAPAVE